MSGLSARTYSCGGDGDRLRGGGDGSLGGCSDSLGKNFIMPDLELDPPSSLSSISTSDGTGDNEDSDERSDESSSADMLGLSVVESLVAVCGEVKDSKCW